MRDFHFGEVIKGDVGQLEFRLPENVVLVWKDSKPAEAILCESISDLPKNWVNSLIPLKIFGSFNNIKKMFPDFSIPTGSKVIDLAAGALIQMNFSQNSIRYAGTRNKRVVIVDDSSTIRKLLSKIISSYEGWTVVAEVEDANDIPKALTTWHPDLVTLDLNLGAVNGAEAMKKYLAPKKIPTLLITSQSKEDGSLVMDALDAGALDYLQKPESGKWESMKEELHLKMETALKSRWVTKGLSKKKVLNHIEGSYHPADFLVAIGSSTGGTQALQEIFTNLPANIPPIIVTQHIPEGFSRALADRLNGLCPFEIKEAQDGDEVKPGRVLIAPGNHHMKLSKNGKQVEIFEGEPVNRFRPSVDVMFDSVVVNAKTKVVAIMLTGMGKDGSRAMLDLRKNGAYTIAQDEASCVVFGMPKEAIRIGAAEAIVSLSDMPEFLMNYLTKKSLRTGIV